jgi:hypothetical protein
VTGGVEPEHQLTRSDEQQARVDRALRGDGKFSTRSDMVVVRACSRLFGIRPFVARLGPSSANHPLASGGLMRVLRRWSTIALAAAAVAAVSSAPAVAGGPVSAGGVGTNAIVAIPSDCVLATTGPRSRSLTCSDRPAGQQWRLQVMCRNIWSGTLDWSDNGTIVTGNGTSSASCPDFHQLMDYYNRLETLS